MKTLILAILASTLFVSVTATAYDSEEARQQRWAEADARQLERRVHDIELNSRNY